jgi:hypothetical protein
VAIIELAQRMLETVQTERDRKRLEQIKTLAADINDYRLGKK